MHGLCNDVVTSENDVFLTGSTSFELARGWVRLYNGGVAKALNLEQEQLKATRKLKTGQFEEAQNKLEDWQSEAVSTIKLSYRTEKTKWSEFGIKASK